eukprot:TRINITY_DN794_c0_g1_i2.p1 TRINITY_DN794_c0_g1~~TRINITY_DN794_c0_g1_i2.p1  ORF type:complete len:326 (+),score=49.83 TRINITY_DN794_c0_g1_i2:52-1029(+)
MDSQRQLLDQIRKLEPPLSSKFDALIILIHAIFLDSGFKLVGLGEDGPSVEEKERIPSAWNMSTDSWAFRYRHARSSMTFLLKGIRLQDTILLHACSVEQKELCSVELQVDHFVTNFEKFNMSHLEDLYNNIPELQTQIEQSICRKLVPNEADLPTDELSCGGAPQQPTQSEQPSQPSQPAQPTPPAQPAQPAQPSVQPPSRIPQPDPAYDILRIPSSGSRGSGVPYIGGNDLYPSFGGGYPGAPMPGGGGNLMGPNHPFFVGGGAGVYPGVGPGVPGGPGGFPGAFAPPPGARFDPFGPPGANNPVPRPDHLRPPGWDDDSMFG